METLVREPKDAPLVELMKDLSPVDGEEYEGLDDKLSPVHFGIYTIVGHDVDHAGVHTLVIRDNKQNSLIVLRSV